MREIHSYITNLQKGSFQKENLVPSRAIMEREGLDSYEFSTVADIPYHAVLQWLRDAYDLLSLTVVMKILTQLSVVDVSMMYM